MVQQITFLEPWYLALNARIGYVFETDRPKELIQRLYKARKESLDPRLEELSIIRSPVASDSQVWIVKRHVGTSEAHPQPLQG